MSGTFLAQFIAVAADYFHETEAKLLATWEKKIIGYGGVNSSKKSARFDWSKKINANVAQKLCN
jgi:hypothetical protein